MIRLSCPGCEKVLRVPDEAAGRVVNCPACKMKFQVPAAEPDPAPAPPPPGPRRGSGSAPQLPPPPERPARSRDEDRPAPPPPRRDFDDDDDDDDRPRRRRDLDDDDDRPRRKPKRRRAGASSSGFPVVAITLAGVGVSVLSFALAFVFSPFALVALGVGGLMSTAGGIWMLVIAFQEDTSQGLLCLFVPFYGLYYLISRFDRCREAAILQFGGLGVLMVFVVMSCLSAFLFAGAMWNIQRQIEQESRNRQVPAKQGRP